VIIITRLTSTAQPRLIITSSYGVPSVTLDFINAEDIKRWRATNHFVCTYCSRFTELYLTDFLMLYIFTALLGLLYVSR